MINGLNIRVFDYSRTVKQAKKTVDNEGKMINSCKIVPKKGLFGIRGSEFFRNLALSNS